MRRKFKRFVKHFCYQLPNILKYRFLSTNKNIYGKVIRNQAVQINGLGSVTFGNKVMIGIDPSPYLYNSYCYIEARNSESNIFIDDNTFINNNCVIIAEGEGIKISKGCLIGTNCEIVDSDFHNLDPEMRLGANGIKTAKVVLEENVFLGSNVKVLKGVTIGINSVIANGSVVTKSIPKNVIAGGVPAKVIKSL